MVLNVFSPKRLKSERNDPLWMSEDKASLEYLGGIALVKVVHAAAKQ